MNRGKHIAEFCLAVSLTVAATIPLPALAQRNRQHPAPPPKQQPQRPQGQRQAEQHQPEQRQPEQHHPEMSAQPQIDRQAEMRAAQPQGLGQPGGHAGDWLRRYKDLPPDEQEKALQNDQAFQKLPPQRQQMLRQRLQHFSNLTPEKQIQELNRMETWEHLTPEQKQQALQIHSQMQQLPPDRQRMVRTAVRDLRNMPPAQREEIINSERFKGMFSEQERGILREVTRLPLAPAEEGEGAP